MNNDYRLNQVPMREDFNLILNNGTRMNNNNGTRMNNNNGNRNLNMMNPRNEEFVGIIDFNNFKKITKIRSKKKHKIKKTIGKNKKKYTHVTPSKKNKASRG